MAKSPLQDALKKWDQRFATLKQQGVDTNKVEPVMKQDIDRVRQGHSAMTDLEARTVVQGLFTGQAPTQAQHKTSPFGILGNIIPDVSNTITGMLTGIPHFIEHLPSETMKTAGLIEHGGNAQWLQSHGFDPKAAGSMVDPSTWAAALRNVAAPGQLTDLLPLVHTAAGLTTAQGRKGLEQHPVSAVLDVAPVASELGALTGAAAEGAGLIDTAEAGSAAEALRAGHPVKALARSVVGHPVTDEALAPGLRLRVGENVGGTAAGRALAGALSDFRGRFHITDADIKLAGALATSKRGVYRATRTFTSTLNRALKGKSAEEVAQITREATELPKGDPSIPPDHQQIIDIAQNISDQLAEIHARNGDLVAIQHDGQNVYYPNDSRVVRALRSMQRQQGRLAEQEPIISEQLARAMDKARVRATAELQDAEKELNALLAERAKHQATADSHNFKARQFEEKGTGARSRRYGNLARDSQRSADSLERRIQSARDRVNNLSSSVDNRIRADRRVQQLHSKLDALRHESTTRAAAYQHSLARTAPASFHPALTRQLLARAQETLEGRGVAGPELDTAMQRLERGDPNGYFTAREWGALRREVESTWQELASAGYHPVWMQNIEDTGIHRALASKPTAARDPKPSSIRNRVFDVKPRVTNIAIGLTAPAVEMFDRLASHDMIERFVAPHAIPLADALEETHKLMDTLGEDVGPMESPSGQFYARLNDRYVGYDADTLAHGQTPTSASDLARANTGEQQVIPREVFEPTQRLLTPKETKPIYEVSRKITTLEKRAVMGFSIKHVAHIQLGGLVQLAFRADPRALLPKYWLTAWHDVRNGNMPVELANAEDAISAAEMFGSTDKMYNHIYGAWLGKMWNGLGDVGERIRKMDEFVANIQRTVDYLSQYDRNVAHGMTADLAKDTALRHAQKTLVDIDNMAPIESTIIRQVFPFYAYTRHILRYVLTYPVDYPLRASMINRIAQIETAHRSSELPQQFEMLWFLGHPDPTGNISAVDIRSLNPFRDVATDMGMAGFIRGLNPLLRAPLQAMGVNTMTASPSTYQDVSYDPVSGKLVAKRPGFGLQSLEQVVPEIGILDHYFTLTQQMRNLKATDPAAYQQQVFSQFFVPFALEHINLPQQQEKGALDQLKVATNAVTAAQQGNLSALDRFTVVPYQGQLVSAPLLKQLLQQLQARAAQVAGPGSSPQTVFTPPRKPKNRTGF